MEFDEVIDRLGQRLGRGDLPGRDAQLLMGHSQRNREYAQLFGTKPHRLGAVLVLLYPLEGRAYFPLLLRHQYPGVHSGQVGLPGGSHDPGDPSLEATALRETWEEIGVMPQDVQILGPLTDLYIPPSNFHVHPYVGFMEWRPAMVKDDREVAKLLETPLAHLLQQGNGNRQRVRLAQGMNAETPCYLLENEIVWGATAMILCELREMLV
ncbi:MAG: CoA pyrophosphatase [Bacteroidetes bacterium]|jgi:8-oxo-dGTP pyrophosphatase MutT (NUDIX family)|nr:CoA pyrophosphatase [Bacteroidota bacterium]